MILKLNHNKIKFLKPTSLDKELGTISIGLSYECTAFEHKRAQSFSMGMTLSDVFKEIPEEIELVGIFKNNEVQQ